MQDWTVRSRLIPGLDSEWRKKARRCLKEQTRPEGSLGFLETAIERFVAIQRKDRPSCRKKRILIFAADHGVAKEGVSLFPREVTQAMVHNFLNGGATVNALAREIQSEVVVVDVGVDGEFRSTHRNHVVGADGHTSLRFFEKKIRRGTRNFTEEPAMTEKELDQALTVGWDLVHEAKREGVELLGLGEMGIGNTTAASAVVAGLTGWPAEEVTGRGTGLDDLGLAHKIEVIKRAIKLHQDFLKKPFDALQRLGGYEIAAMTGAILAAGSLSLPLVVDGWIVSSSALAAIQMNPRILDYLFFAHQSEEYGHKKLLQSLEAQPFLNLSMRLGEASGAALAMGILEAGVRIYNEVATFSEAGVTNRKK